MILDLQRSKGRRFLRRHHRKFFFQTENEFTKKFNFRPKTTIQVVAPGSGQQYETTKVFGSYRESFYDDFSGRILILLSSKVNYFPNYFR